MKGLWKCNVSGYDRKGIKRKKQTFKNMISDIEYSIYKNKNTNLIEFEQKLIKDKNSNFIINFEKTPLYKIEIKFINKQKEIETKFLEIFFLEKTKYYQNGLMIVFNKFKNTFTELIDYLELNREGNFYSNSKEIIEINFLKEIDYLDLTKTINLDIEYKTSHVWDNSKKVFFHGKKIDEYLVKKLYEFDRYENSLTNKDFQKFSNKKIRIKNREYIKRFDWDTNEKNLVSNKKGNEWWSY